MNGRPRKSTTVVKLLLIKNTQIGNFHFNYEKRSLLIPVNNNADKVGLKLLSYLNLIFRTDIALRIKLWNYRHDKDFEKFLLFLNNDHELKMIIYNQLSEILSTTNKRK